MIKIEQKSEDDIQHVLGVMPLIIIFITYSLTVFSLIINIKISILIYYISHIISIYIENSLLKKLKIDKNFRIIIIIGTQVVLLMMLYLESFIYDRSWDGMAYHQEAIIQLAQGWNPFHTKLNDNVINSIWINHYPKLTWIFGANVLLATGSIEAAKAYNVYFLLSLFMIVWSFIKYDTNINSKYQIIVALIIAGNPVIINQIFTTYNDGSLYAISIIYLISALKFLKENSQLNKVILFISAIFLINIKFTGLIYFIIITLGIIIFKISNKEFEINLFLKITFLSFFFGITIFGFNPYIKNLIDNNHIFFPLFGYNSIDIISPVLPEGLKELNRFYLFLKLLTHFSNLGESIGYDSRIGGFGITFPIIVFLSFLSFSYLIIKDYKNRNLILLIFLILSVLVFINPAPSMARYVPHAWLFPTIISIFGISSSYILLKNLSIKILYIQFITVFFIFQIGFIININDSLIVSNQLNNIKKSGKKIIVDLGPFESFRLRFKNQNIDINNIKLNNTILNSDFRCIEGTWCEVKFKYMAD
jgi:hypothetical protein